MKQYLITVGKFLTMLGKYKDDNYYYFTLSTFPKTVDVNKKFKSVKTAGKYFHKKIIELCKETINFKKPYIESFGKD